MQTEEAPTGSGLSTLPIATQGSGYIGAPYVSISGTGLGATAIANMIDDGTGNGTFKVGSITITNPGVDYTGQREQKTKGPHDRERVAEQGQRAADKLLCHLHNGFQSLPVTVLLLDLEPFPLDGDPSLRLAADLRGQDAPVPDEGRLVLNALFASITLPSLVASVARLEA